MPPENSEEGPLDYRINMEELKSAASTLVNYFSVKVTN